MADNVQNWRGVYADRFLDRVAIQRPRSRHVGRPIYTRLTDEQIEMMPESVRGLARICRAFGDSLTASLRPAGDPPARSEGSPDDTAPEGLAGPETGPSSDGEY